MVGSRKTWEERKTGEIGRLGRRGSEEDWEDRKTGKTGK
jgi:hypothetical protein